MARPRARAVAIAVVVLTAAALGAAIEAQPATTEPDATTIPIVTPPSTPPTPSGLSAQIAELADTTAVQWPAHEYSSGALDDPVLGPMSGNYGVSMTGQAIIDAGIASANETLIGDGLRSLLSEMRHPNGGGFELLGLSEAYSVDQAQLGADPSWRAVRGRIARFLRRRGRSISDLGRCYTSPRCYTNLKLVSAVADLALLRTGLRGDQRTALLSSRAALRRQALGWIRMAVHNTGDDAYRVGTDSFSQAGLLSDPTENPLAYHALSTMMLGNAILMLGSQAPLAAHQAFDHAARAVLGLLAPDGDDSYVGRGQAQVWTVAASIDALAIAAELTSDGVWRGRYLDAAALSLARLQALYPSSGWGFPLVPRLAHVATPSSYRGIDHYANSVEYNGLALWALNDAATQLAHAQPAPAQTLPADGDGAFVDPSHAQFAAVTHGGLWYAIHATDSNPGDARYGFGLVAAEIDTVDGWEPALPQRPITKRQLPGGLAMVTGHHTLYPAGQQINAGTGGEVRIAGGWRNGSRIVDHGTLWTFRRAAGGDGVTLSFAAQPGAAYAIQVWYEAGSQLARSLHGLSVAEPDGSTQTYSISARVRFSAGASGDSAYFGSLRSVVMTLAPASAPRIITYTTLLSAPAPALGSSGASGASGASSGASGSSGGSGSSGASGSSSASGSSGASGLTGH